MDAPDSRSSDARRLVAAVERCVVAGDTAAAEAACRAALRDDPRCIPALNILGMIAYQAGRLADAEAAWRPLYALTPDNAELVANLAAVLAARGRSREALDLARRAAELEPTRVENHVNHAVALLARGRDAEAAEVLTPVAAAAPRHLDVLNTLAIALERSGRLDEAAATCGRAIEADPRNATALDTLARVHVRRKSPDEALAVRERLLAVAPAFAQSWNNYGGELLEVGDATGAVAAFRRALAIDPALAAARSSLLLTLHYDPRVTPQQLADEHRVFGQMYGVAVPAVHVAPREPAAPARRLRVAYLSRCFFRHAVAVFSEPVLRCHDRARFEVTCYADVRKPDAVTERFRGYADRWRDVAPLSDVELIDAIRADAPDVLVDLHGHLPRNRLLALAHKPAPIQVTYIGYQNTTGLAAMDYRLTDAWADPPDAAHDALYSERLERLACFFVYQPPDGAPPVAPPPAARNGYVTFGSFNHPGKVSEAAVELWSRILRRVPRARLLLLVNARGRSEERLRAQFGARGIDAGARVEFVLRGDQRDYLASYARLDVALDPMPFSGHTTTCDALWMGVPVVTLPGRTYASRMTASVLANFPLPALIAASADGYVELAASLAEDVPGLARLRAEMRERMRGSPITDAVGFTRSLETAYHGMWARWRASSDASPGRV